MVGVEVGEGKEEERVEVESAQGWLILLGTRCGFADEPATFCLRSKAMASILESPAVEASWS